MKVLSGKVAAVTGAGSGLGRAVALQLAAEGCELAVSDVDAKGLQCTVELLNAADCPVVSSAHVDVSDWQAVQNWSDLVVARHKRVNILVNNAGVALSGTAQAQTIEDYQWITGINYWGVIHGCKAFLPHLEGSESGHIVNISSIAGVLAQPLIAGYSATKFAVRGYTESLRQDLEITRSCVSASCIHPGGIKTQVAKNARQTSSVSELLGVSPDEITRQFEKTFITTPEKAAKIIIKAVKKNRRRVLIGVDAYVQDWLVRLLPSFYQRVVVAFIRWQTQRVTGRKP